VQSELPLFPERASNFAGNVDALFFFLLLVTIFFSGLITFAILYCFLKFRRKRKNEIGVAIDGPAWLETAWIAVPAAISVLLFGWGATIYVSMRRPPKEPLEIYVIAKQWMWKLQQPDGRREINELHIPVDRDILLTMASEDVIHDFFVPAFRVKADVVPVRSTAMWFRATRTGRYHFFCAQYCGTNHAVMGGWVTVLAPAEYEAWVSGSSGEVSPVAAGEKFFEQLACNTCHTGSPQARGPALNGLYGSAVHLEGGQTVIADDAYLRESILQPRAKIVAGYQPVMPTFQGLVTEEQILDLIAYIKSLSAAPSGAATNPPAAPGATPLTAPQEKKTR
jgi:cytochrome c oxidase subunit 2